MVFDQTPFYGESGGQVGDQGYIEAGSERIPIFDTQKENNLIVHLVEKVPVDPERSFRAVVDVERRNSIANNHTATHLLHAALREVLGTHVEQKGSLVNADHLRFDFSHFQKVTEEELAEVEKRVNEKIRRNALLEENRSLSIDEAKSQGAMMLFGEKYGDHVRVIKFGESVELCGGTHVQATGQIGILKIVSESAVAAGIRRIEAVTAARAEKYINDRLSLLQQIKEAIKGSQDVLEGVVSLMSQNQELSKQIENFELEGLKIAKSNLKSQILMESGVNMIAEMIDINNPALIKDLAFQLKSEVDDLFLVLGANVNGKPLLTVMISENIVEEKGLHAGKIVSEAAKEMKGGGGGQPFYATAGGKDLNGLKAAVEKAKSFAG